MSDRKIARTDWVYWVTLIVICGQLALWATSTVRLVQGLYPLTSFITPIELVGAIFDRLGALRFVHYYVLSSANILLYMAIVLLLLLRNTLARRAFLASLFVGGLGQILDALMTLPGGSTRDWVTTLAGNVVLAIYLWLLYLAFNHLCRDELSSARLHSEGHLK